MRDLKINTTELPVPAAGEAEITNNCCSKIDDIHYQIAGQAVNLPVKVDSASMLMNIFTVDTKRLKGLLEGSGFSPVELYPGKALMQLLGVDYQQNELGDYNEAAIIFPVTTPGQKPVRIPIFGALKRMASGGLGNFVYRMPVDQGFTTHAGRYIWGFPKWVTRVDFSMDEKTASARFIDEQELVFAIQAPAGGKLKAEKQDAPSLAIRDGKAWRTVGSTEGEGLRFSLGGKKPEIGDSHPLAVLLRELGLPKRPLCTVSMKKAVMSFAAPESVPLGQPFAAEAGSN